MKQFILLSLLIIGIVSAPVLAITDKTDMHKSILLHYNIKSGNITFLDGHLFYGYSPDLTNTYDTFTGKLIGLNDSVISKFQIMDPRITFTDKGTEFRDNKNFSVIIPYSKDIPSLEIYERDNQTLQIRTDLKPLIKDFCKSHPNDPDCSLIQPWMLPIVILIVIVVGCGVVVLLLKKKRQSEKK